VIFNGKPGGRKYRVAIKSIVATHTPANYFCFIIMASENKKLTDKKVT
jgi:hypothetical protein